MGVGKIFLFFILVFVILYFVFISRRTKISLRVESVEDLVNLFPKTSNQIKKNSTDLMNGAKKKIGDIVSLQRSERNFANTALACDKILSNLSTMIGILSTVRDTYPQENMRNAARDYIIAIQMFIVDHLLNNRDLYKAFKAYTDGNAKQENLSAEKTYFLQEIMQQFEKNGLNLPEDRLNEVKKLTKEIVALSQEYQKNVADDNRFILVKNEDLVGIEKDFIDSLEHPKKGFSKIGVDVPTYVHIMTNCGNGKVRKNLYKEYLNRGYPKNETILKEIIKKRDKKAKLIGFDSYVHFDCSDQMAKNPQRVEDFISNRTYAEH